MSLPQLIGMQCVACEKSITSIIDGAYCDACGNPVHRKCAGAAQTKPERCPQCGGDPASSTAKEVRRERGTAAQELALSRPRSTSSVGQPDVYSTQPVVYPISNVCPKCSSTSFKPERPKSWIAFAKDRVCTECGTRYTPPTPVWGAVVFLLAGLLLVGFGGICILMRVGSGNPLEIPAMICEGSLGILGLLALGHGIRVLANSGKV